MFTGLIREMAEVVNFDGQMLSLKAKYHPNVGDSIAVNGVCLTVVKVDANSFTVEIADETRSVVALENFSGYVHIEPAMRMGDRFEGHIVQGHIDTIGKIAKIKKRTNGTDFYITIPTKFLEYVTPKGSVTVDGVSLTVNDVDGNGFYLTIIPHTIKATRFKIYSVGTRVNIETDLFARYIANILDRKEQNKKIEWERIEHIQSLY